MRALDLFSGIGGFALGMQWAGFPPPVAFCEQDEFCQRVLRKHWPDVPIHDDVKDLRGDEHGPVELVCGGFPCQPWSVAGRRGGTDDDRDLWPEMRRVVAAARPRWVFGENVSGLVGEPMGLDRVLADLEALGYACQALCIPACAVDAPHIRDRVWIVAHASGLSGQQDARGALGNEAPHGRAGRHAIESNGHHGSPGGGKGCQLAHARPGERRDDGAQREAAERGGRMGDSDDREGPVQQGGPERAQRRRAGDASDGRMDDSKELRPSPWTCEPRGRRAASEPERPNAWSNAEWLHCAFDDRARRVEPGIRLLAHGIPGRVARLRALGNAVVPQVVEQIGRAILEAEAA